MLLCQNKLELNFYTNKFLSTRKLSGCSSIVWWVSWSWSCLGGWATMITWLLSLILVRKKTKGQFVNIFTVLVMWVELVCFPSQLELSSVDDCYKSRLFGKLLYYVIILCSSRKRSELVLPHTDKNRKWKRHFVILSPSHCYQSSLVIRLLTSKCSQSSK